MQTRQLRLRPRNRMEDLIDDSHKFGGIYLNFALFRVYSVAYPETRRHRDVRGKSLDNG